MYNIDYAPYDRYSEIIVAELAEEYNMSKADVRAIINSPFRLLKTVVLNNTIPTNLKSMRIPYLGSFRVRKNLYKCLISRDQPL